MTTATMKKISITVKGEHSFWFDPRGDGWVTNTHYLLHSDRCQFHKREMKQKHAEGIAFRWTKQRGMDDAEYLPDAQKLFDEELRKGVGVEVRIVNTRPVKHNVTICELESFEGTKKTLMDEKYKHIVDAAAHVYVTGTNDPIRLADEEGNVFGLLMPIKSYR